MSRPRPAGHGASLRDEGRDRLDTSWPRSMAPSPSTNLRVRRHQADRAQGRPARRPGLPGAPDQGFLDRHGGPHDRDGRRPSSPPRIRRACCRPSPIVERIPDRLRRSGGIEMTSKGKDPGSGSHRPHRLYGRHGASRRISAWKARDLRQGQPHQARLAEPHGLLLPADPRRPENFRSSPSTISTRRLRAASFPTLGTLRLSGPRSRCPNKADDEGKKAEGPGSRSRTSSSRPTSR